MKYKNYQTFDQLNKDLAILKVEKDLAYQRLLKEVDETKESLEFKNLIGDTPKKIINILGIASGPLKSALITFILRKIF